MSYNDKHNEANGEDNNDGESHNRSWNLGVEGPTDDPEILALRARQQRNFITTLLLSQGVPMLLHGDEAGRTQDGNNNTYAQDGPISWLHWDDVDEPLVEFTADVARLRRDHPTFRRRRFFTGTTVRTAPARASGSTTSSGCTPTGTPMEDGDWSAPDARSIGMYLNGHGIAGPDARGQDVVGRPLPALLQRRRRRRTADAAARGVRRRLGRRDRHRRGRAAPTGRSRAGVRSKLGGRSVLVLREHTAPTRHPGHLGRRLGRRLAAQQSRRRERDDRMH